MVQGMLTVPLAPSNSMIPVLAVDCLVAARNSLMDVAPGCPADTKKSLVEFTAGVPRAQSNPQAMVKDWFSAEQGRLPE
jgi:hypothetical protein